jgi:hypothetical protein
MKILLIPISLVCVQAASVEPPMVRFILNRIRESKSVMLLSFPKIEGGPGARNEIPYDILELPFDENLVGFPIVPIPPSAQGASDLYPWAKKKGPQNEEWMILDCDGNRLAGGRHYPDPKAIANILTTHGYSSLVAALRRHIQRNPDALDAHGALLRSLRRDAERLTQKATGISIHSIAEQIADGSLKAGIAQQLSFNNSHLVDLPEHPKMLSPMDDIRIWGQYAAELGFLFSTGRWYAAGVTFNALVNSPAEVSSHLIQGLYARNIHLVEEAIEKEPRHAGLWSMWAWMASVVGDKRVQPLLDNLIPVPPLSKGRVWPPRIAVAWMVRQEQQTEKNQQLLVELEPILRQQLGEFDRSDSVDLDASAPPIFEDLFNEEAKDLFDGLICPYLKACFILGESSKAIAMGTRLQASFGWPRWVGPMVSIAKKYNQASIAQTWEKASPAPVQWTALDRILWANHLGSIIVYEGKDTNWKEAFNNLMKQKHPDDFKIPVIRFQFTFPSGDWITSREGWEKNKPHWAVMDATGKVLCQGVSLPSQEEFQEKLGIIGIKSKANILVDFIKEHPSNEEARRALLVELGRTCNELTAIETGIKSDYQPLTLMYANGISNGRFPPLPPPTDTMLDEATDERIWTEFAGQLDQYLLGESWLRYDFDEMGLSEALGAQTIQPVVVPPLGSTSPLVINICTKHMSRVEIALKSRSDDPNLWFLWLTLNRIVGKNDFIDLISECTPSPHINLNNWPPPVVCLAYLRDCQARKDWGNVQSIGEQLWTKGKALLGIDKLLKKQNSRLGSDQISKQIIEMSICNLIMIPLFESYVAQGKELEAERLIDDWRAFDGDSAQLIQAADIAKGHHEDSLSSYIASAMKTKTR